MIAMEFEVVVNIEISPASENHPILQRRYVPIERKFEDDFSTNNSATSDCSDVADLIVDTLVHEETWQLHQLFNCRRAIDPKALRDGIVGVFEHPPERQGPITVTPVKPSNNQIEHFCAPVSKFAHLIGSKL